MKTVSVAEDFKKLKDFYRDDRFNTRTFREQRKHVLSMLGKGKGLILEIGAGPAMLGTDITRLGYSYIALDLVKEMLLAAVDRLAACKSHGIVADIAEQPFQSGLFKSVIGMGVLEYVKDLDKALKEIFRVSGAGHSVIISVPHCSSPYRMSCYAWKRIKNTIKRLIYRPGSPIFGNVSQVLTARQWRRAMTKAGYKITADAYCNFRLIPEPMNSWFPRFSETVGAKLERFCENSSPFRAFGTQYIMKLRRKTS